MAIYKKQKLIKRYPAFDVYRREINHLGFIEISTDDILIDSEFHLTTYQPGSIVSSALENGQCPIQSIDTCKQNMLNYPGNGHRLHWLNERAISISSAHHEKIDVIEIFSGSNIKFEGSYFKIEKKYNPLSNLSNLYLKPIQK